MVSSKLPHDLITTDLFLDEVLPFYILLDVTDESLSSEEFRIFALSVNVLINTKVVGGTGAMMADGTVKQNNPPNRKQAFEIFTTVVDNLASLVYCGKDPDNEETNKWTALWQVSIDVSHPRIRLFKPELVIDVTASYDGTNISSTITDQSHPSVATSNETTSESEPQKTIFLEEFMPAEDINIFETLSTDKHLKEFPTKLSLNCVTSNHRSQPPNGEFSDNDSSAKSTPQPSRSNTPSQFRLQPPPSGKNRHASATDSSDTPASKQSSDVIQSAISASSQKHIATIVSSIQLPVFPAVNLRLRCTKSSGAQNSIVAILEIENSETAQFSVLIKSAYLEFTAGSAVLFGDCTFPLWLSPGENFTMAYHLSHADAGLLKSRVKPMTILLNSVPVLSEISEQDIKDLDNEASTINYSEVGPLVLTKWDTIVDFGVAAIPGASSSLAPVALGSASGAVKKLFKVSRTASVTSLRSVASGNGASAADSHGGPDSARDSRSNTVTSQLSGFLISFSGPSTVKVGEVFKWRVFAINKSQHSKHLTLYIQPREKGFRASPQATLSSYSFAVEKQLPLKPEVSPILDRPQLLKLYEDCQTISVSGSTGIVSLMNDVRIGPLHANACFETEISMLALVTGQYSLEGLCVIDLNTGDSYDCGKLLDVVITE